jgi:type I restriction enzyme, S subunit
MPSRSIKSSTNVMPPPPSSPRSSWSSAINSGGDMPTEWSLARIADVVDPTRPVTYGVVQPGDRQTAGIPLIRGKDYSSGEISGDDLYMIHSSIARAYRRSVVQGGDLLLSIVGYVGQSAVVPQKLAGANITQTTARIAIRKGLSSRYFLHQLRGLTFQREVRRYMKGSAQPGLNLSDVEQMQILVPPPLEQWRIAEILDAMDEVIRSTERLIAKLEQAKQGLLHDLLSGQICKFVRGQDRCSDQALGSAR